MTRSQLHQLFRQRSILRVEFARSATSRLQESPVAAPGIDDNTLALDEAVCQRPLVELTRPFLTGVCRVTFKDAQHPEVDHVDGILGDAAVLRSRSETRAEHLAQKHNISVLQCVTCIRQRSAKL